jgi:hypothetical protein
VDFPIKNGDFPVRYFSLPEGNFPKHTSRGSFSKVSWMDLKAASGCGLNGLSHRLAQKER